MLMTDPGFRALIRIHKQNRTGEEKQYNEKFK